jgi:hypothetical protein
MEILHKKMNKKGLIWFLYPLIVGASAFGVGYLINSVKGPQQTSFLQTTALGIPIWIILLIVVLYLFRK